MSVTREFNLRVLQLLCQRPYRRQELAEVLEREFPETRDIQQRIDRSIKRWRDLGCDIESGKNLPYTLRKSGLPLLLSEEQKQAIALASQLLESLGFAAEGAHLREILITSAESVAIPFFASNFNPPTTYSDSSLRQKIATLRDRLAAKRRFVIRYRNSKGEEHNWDIDLAQLHLHDGILFLFAHVPTPPIIYDHNDPTARNFSFRIDRIQDIGASSITPWYRREFPTLTVQYLLYGDLRSYQSRRPQEEILQRTDEYVIVKSREVSSFWFQQRVFRYLPNCQILSPQWLQDKVNRILREALVMPSFPQAQPQELG